MADKDVALTILRQKFLDRINFTFPGGSGDVTVDGGSFRRLVALIVSDKITVVADPTLTTSKGAWDSSTNTLTVATILGRDGEATVVHECLHGLFDIEGTSVLVAQEEAACYVVDVLYYKMTGFKESRYLNGKAMAIKKAAQPVADTILAGSATGFGNPTAVDPAQFGAVVTAVLAIPYYANAAQGGAAYTHDG